MKSGNIFLLTHKCGNHFVREIFSRVAGTARLVSLQPTDDLASILRHRAPFLNIRCRNFPVESVDRLSAMFDPGQTRYFLFLRHPASFFRSAVTYHLRGDEPWCRTLALDHFQGRSLYEELHARKDLDERLIAVMTHFGVAQRTILRWVESLEYLRSSRLCHEVIHVESLWGEAARESLSEFARSLCHDGFEIDEAYVMQASPSGKQELSRHSTGECKQTAYAGYGPKAMEFYEAAFKPFESILGYDQAAAT